MGLFQPDFIYVIFRSSMPSKYNRTDDDIETAVNMWCKDPTEVEAEVKYGHISKWNTSLVTKMKKLFFDKRDFNDAISKWIVSSVTNMRYSSAIACLMGIYLDGMSAVLLTWIPCSI
jgi:hypothetical protein